MRFYKQFAPQIYKNNIYGSVNTADISFPHQTVELILFVETSMCPTGTKRHIVQKDLRGTRRICCYGIQTTDSESSSRHGNQGHRGNGHSPSFQEGNMCHEGQAQACTMLGASQAQSLYAICLKLKPILKLSFVPSLSTNGFPEKGTSKRWGFLCRACNVNRRAANSAHRNVHKPF